MKVLLTPAAFKNDLCQSLSNNQHHCKVAWVCSWLLHHQGVHTEPQTPVGYTSCRPSLCIFCMLFKVLFLMKITTIIPFYSGLFSQVLLGDCRYSCQLCKWCYFPIMVVERAAKKVQHGSFQNQDQDRNPIWITESPVCMCAWPKSCPGLSLHGNIFMCWPMLESYN